MEEVVCRFSCGAAFLVPGSDRRLDLDRTFNRETSDCEEFCSRSLSLRHGGGGDEVASLTPSASCHWLMGTRT
jgi:hypothetical protein